MNISNWRNYILPIRLERDSEYLPSLKAKLNELVCDIEDLDLEAASKDNISQFGSSIADAVRKYLEGDLIASYEIVDRLVVDVKDEDGVVSSINNSRAFWGVPYPAKEVQLYRARLSDHVVEFKETDMLHIPFDMREKVATQRFSIPGLPCLYLGNTSYCCWVEMGMPADHWVLSKEATMKLKKEFSDFYKAIRIDSESHALKQKREVLEEDIRSNLPDILADHSISLNKSDIRMIDQGSYKYNTTIKDNVVDRDVAVIIPLDTAENDDPRTIKGYLEDAITIPARTVSIKEPCVRASYYDHEVEWLHIDLPLYAKDGDSTYLARGKKYSRESAVQGVWYQCRIADRSRMGLGALPHL